MSGSGAQLSGPGAQLSGSGAQLSAILVCIRTYVISAPLYMHVREILQKYIYESDQGLVAAGYSIYILYIYYRYSNKINRHKGQKRKLSKLALANFLSALYCFLNLLKIFF